MSPEKADPIIPLPTALCLAAATYAGWSRFDQADEQETAVRTIVRKVLDRLHTEVPALGRWQLLWGPACARTPGSLLDDAMVCLFRSVDDPTKVVVAVRGTNPAAPIDWVLGDFWVAAKVAWPFADDGAAISASTALGLGAVRQLRARPPADAESGSLSNAFLGVLASVTKPIRTGALELLSKLAGDVSSDLYDSRARLRRISGLLPPLPMGTSPASQLDLATLELLWRNDGALDDLQRTIQAAADRLADRRAFDLLRLFEGGTRLREHLEGGGTNLVEALRAATKQHPKTDVIVTGHSKGAAVAVALATWLGDTQGNDAATAHQWDPKGDATVHCIGFAGPSAGNGAFAKHAERVIRGTHVRVVNPLDAVPRAWVPATIETIGSMYEGTTLPGLDVLAKVIAQRVTRLEHAHAGTEELLKPVLKPRASFVDQLIHQHLEAYLRAYALPEEIGMELFFGIPQVRD